MKSVRIEFVIKAESVKAMKLKKKNAKVTPFGCFKTKMLM
jgi:hypothetical protein